MDDRAFGVLTAKRTLHCMAVLAFLAELGHGSVPETAGEDALNDLRGCIAWLLERLMAALAAQPPDFCNAWRRLERRHCLPMLR